MGGDERKGGTEIQMSVIFLSYPYIFLWLLSPCHYQFKYFFNYAGRTTATVH